MGEPLTLRTPFPERTEATATEFFFLPKHWTSLDLLSDIWLAINYYFNKNEDLLHHSVRVLMIFFHLHARAIAIIS
jgi:hypothetical protein